MKIKILKAFNGDCIWINFIDKQDVHRNILIDGGITRTYQQDKDSKGKIVPSELQYVIDSIRNLKQKIDLLILTHIDDDHIGGILKWFQKDKEAYTLITEVWFNSGGLISEILNIPENSDLEILFDDDSSDKTSVLQGKKFAEYISENKIWFRELILQGQTLTRYGLEFKILSPDKIKLEKLLKEWTKKDPDLKTAAKENDYAISISDHIKADIFKEDTAVANGSSIAFILTWENKNFLFLSDAHPAVIAEGLKIFNYSAYNLLDCEFVKLSHHGSSGNTAIELLNCVECNNFIISTNGSIHQHPHKQMLARLINQKPGCKMWFTYKERMDMIFSEKDREEYSDIKINEIATDFIF